MLNNLERRRAAKRIEEFIKEHGKLSFPEVLPGVTLHNYINSYVLTVEGREFLYHGFPGLVAYLTCVFGPNSASYLFANDDAAASWDNVEVWKWAQGWYNGEGI